MAQGLLRWAESSDQGEAWFARVEFGGGHTSDVSKVEYDAAGHDPPFWQLPKKRLASYSAVVAEGMKRVCKDFTTRIAPFGFVKTGRRLWTRVDQWCVESIHLHRSGSSYGAPMNASVGIRVMIGVRVLNAAEPGDGVGFFEDAPPRRYDGTSYQRQFNAETWNAYERCVDDLVLYVSERAEPWFAKLRDADELAAHPDLRDGTRVLLREAVAGRTNAKHYEASLRAMGIKRRVSKA